MSVDSSGNQKVDFAWGNVPMQPNEDRDGDGAVVVEAANLDQNRGWSGYRVFPSELLNEALDNHLLVSTGHNGYPGYLPGDVDAIPGNIPIPDLVGGTVEFATAQWVSAGFNSANIIINYVPNAGGATPTNNGKVASQEPEAGHTADADHVITLNVYQYVEPYIFKIPVADFGPNAWQLNGSTKNGGEANGFLASSSLPSAFSNFYNTYGTNGFVGKTLTFTSTGITELDNEPIVIFSWSSMGPSFNSFAATCSLALASYLASTGAMPMTGYVQLS